MSTAIAVHVGLVDQSGRVPQAELQKLAGALNEQVHNEVHKDWGVLASVGVYTAESLPPHTWAVYLQEQLDQPGALGYHANDQTNQPEAFVELTSDYTVTVSHELLEMLVDPYGNRTHTAAVPQGIDPSQVGLRSGERVAYLVEACDPCEAASYPVGGVSLSDYMLNRWYRSAPGRNAWFSHLGTCTAPRQVADGGYVSFGRADNEWFQVFNQSGSLQLQDIGQFSRADFASLREFTDHHARAYRTDLGSHA